jgi:arylsulfatase A-like enzyme
MDTVRPDHLSVYGYDRDTSPELARLAEQGVLFKNAYSHSGWTVSSHASLFTGLDPLEHGIVKMEHGVAPDFTTLAERLKAEGYATAAFVGTRSTGQLGSQRGFDQGFDLYAHYPHPKRYRRGFLARKLDHLMFVLRGTVGQATPEIDSARSWLINRSREPFFLFVHLFDAHSKEFKLPYEAPEPFFDMFCPGDFANYSGCRNDDLCASKYLREISNGAVPPPSPAEMLKMLCLYDGGVRYVDHEVGRLLRTLDEEGLSENSIVVVTADHGEHFYEHNTMLHHSYYEETLRIPLLIRVPGGSTHKRVNGVVYQTDLVPTILDLIGMPKVPMLRGRSFASALRSVSVEAADPGLRVSHNPTISTVLRDGPLKYIRNHDPFATFRGVPPEELYNLSRDPHEQDNLASFSEAKLEIFRSQLKEKEASSEILREQIFQHGSPLEIVPSDEEMEHLRALGYGE